MMMGAKTFVDTNVLLRATIKSAPLHEEAKQIIFRQQAEGVELWISRQVIREYMAQVTRPQSFMQPMIVFQLETQITLFERLYKIADETAQTTARLMKLLKEFPTGGRQIHDANIVATMLVYEVDALLTQNIEDMRRFGNLVTLIPLVSMKE